MTGGLGSCLLAAVLSLPCLAWAQAPDAGAADPLAIGRRIYREGILPSGQPLQGVGQASVVLSGAQAACQTCHRRSGYGSSEGPIEVRAITGPALFGERVAPAAPGEAALSMVAPPAKAGLSAADIARVNASVLRAARTAAFAGTRQRPAYDDATLARSIREGVDVAGRHMNASMPRYALDAVSLESLTAYLKTLSVHSSPGVTDDKIHFATVIQPGTNPAKRRAMVDVLQTFMTDRNLGQRAEVRRELSGQVRLKRTFREWVLHVWDLSGDASTWAKQLDAYNQQQPVFALVSGLGMSSWKPIHDFSEQHEIPSIFPQVDVPVLADRDVYTVYLSRGLTLEADALAQFLRGEGGNGPVIQVYRRDEAGTAAANAFRQARGATGVVDRVLDGVADKTYWQRLAREAGNATVVLWLASEDLSDARVLTGAGSKVKLAYLSSSFGVDPATAAMADAAGRWRMVYPQDLPASRDARLSVVKRWLGNNGIQLTDEKVQMNAYLAATVTGMVLSHSMDIYSREFVLERLEHRLGTALELSIYPHLSLGPGQRYASKGSYIVEIDGQGGGQLKAVSDWIVP